MDILLPEGDRVRYTVREPGFVVGLDANIGAAAELAFRLIDARGGLVAGGAVSDWRDQDAAVATRCEGWARLDAAAQTAIID